MLKFGKLVASLLASAGIVGSLATIPNIPTWSASLHKPLCKAPLSRGIGFFAWLMLPKSYDSRHPLMDT